MLPSLQNHEYWTDAKKKCGIHRAPHTYTLTLTLTHCAVLCAHIGRTHRTDTRTVFFTTCASLNSYLVCARPHLLSPQHRSRAVRLYDGDPDAPERSAPGRGAGEPLCLADRTELRADILLHQFVRVQIVPTLSAG